jgi:hypothetical protein
MGRKEKQAYLEKIRNRYRNSGKEKKASILNEFCTVCDYHRKHAIRLLGMPFRRLKKLKPRGRKSIYNIVEILEPLKSVWLTADQMCSKKLKEALPIWLPFYEKENGLLKNEVKTKLLSVSPATIDRLLKPIKVNQKRKGLCGTRPGSLLKNQIPIKTNNWDVTVPGFCEADTVAHCGNSLVGDFVCSITMTDICSTWTENRAIWGKGSTGVLKQVSDIERSLPFRLLGFDCDNGSEFLNYHLINYFGARPKEQIVQFTRSRPYHKNDNAHVEQKNWTHVRQLLGYNRFDKIFLVELMNDLYRNELSLLQNYFYPTMKLVSKQKINSKYQKNYDTPKTPYQRLLDSPHINNDMKQRIINTFNQLNPFALKRQITIKLNNIFKHL